MSENKGKGRIRVSRSLLYKKRSAWRGASGEGESCFVSDKIIKKDFQGRTITTLFFIVFLTKLVSPTILLQLRRVNFFQSL